MQVGHRRVDPGHPGLEVVAAALGEQVGEFADPCGDDGHLWAGGGEVVQVAELGPGWSPGRVMIQETRRRGEGGVRFGWARPWLRYARVGSRCRGSPVPGSRPAGASPGWWVVR